MCITIKNEDSDFSSKIRGTGKWVRELGQIKRPAVVEARKKEAPYLPERKWAVARKVGSKRLQVLLLFFQHYSSCAKN